MVNCPNCGAVIEPYKCKCDFCGSWYFDFAAFDMSDDKPYYVKFRTPYGVITTLARPEIETINIWNDSIDITDGKGNVITRLTSSKHCDLGVTFHSYSDPANNRLYTLEVNK